MRLSSLVGTGLVMLALSATGALAQNSRPDIALSTSPYGAMSCGKFLGLGPGDRDAIVRKMVSMAPASSLAPMNAQSGVDQSSQALEQENTLSQPPLDSGRLVSVCQAANTDSSLRDAYSRSIVQPDILIPTDD